MHASSSPQSPFVYQDVLGSVWQELPEPLRQLHIAAHAAGMASVERGSSRLSRLAAMLAGFPEAAAAIPIRVDFRRNGRSETWIRTFGSKRFSSILSAARSNSDALLVERFGPFSFAMALIWDDATLHLILRRWSFLGLPLPMSICPRAKATEYVDDGRFCFDIEISHVMLGLIVRYRGWLTAQEQP